MYERFDRDYDETLGSAPVEGEVLAKAGETFRGLLEEMGIDPLDRAEWLGRFLERLGCPAFRAGGAGKDGAFAAEGS
jgi:hypothetical protein